MNSDNSRSILGGVHFSSRFDDRYVESPVRLKAAMFERLSRSTSSSPPPPKPIATSSATTRRSFQCRNSFPLGNLVKSRHDWIKNQQFRNVTGRRESDLMAVHPRKERTRVGERSNWMETRQDMGNKPRSWITKKMEERDPAENSWRGSRVATVSKATDIPRKDPKPNTSIQSPSQTISLSQNVRLPPKPFERENCMQDATANPCKVIPHNNSEEDLHKVAYFIKHHRSLTRVTVVENASTQEMPMGPNLRKTGILSSKAPEDLMAPHKADNVRDSTERRLRSVSTVSTEDEWKLIRVDSAVCPRSSPVEACAGRFFDVVPLCSVAWEDAQKTYRALW